MNKFYKTYSRRNLILMIFGIFLVLYGGYAVAKYYVDVQTREAVADKVLRFHVLAESDSEDDQRRKLLVRDAVGAWMRQHAEGVESRAELEALITEQSDEIRNVAERTLAEDGESQTVTVRLADVEFPEKEYGDYAFPAGTYRALQIIIGSGQGHNWWCVLYPNLCFSAEGYDVTAGGAKKELSRLLSPSEYESILKNHRYRLGFRFLK